MKDEQIRRVHGRIIFGEGSESWSFTDIDTERMAERIEAAKNKYELGQPLSSSEWFALFAPLCEWQYILCTCPTTELALSKVRQIRRALRQVPVTEMDPK